LPVEIVANRTQRVRARLEPLAGSLVVNSDVRDALVTVDGEPRAFTPAVIELPVGSHDIVISQPGFGSISRRVQVHADASTKLDLELSGQEQVLGASRAAEPVEDAPASVTIISREELRAMAYPTIAEAIRGVRGIYLSYDDTYHSTGVRGFSPPGDSGNRILVLYDGRPLNDNWMWSSYVGFDARVDLDDVERIEVIRGAGSVIHGTGAFFGVINLVTRSKDAPTHAELAVSTALGAGRARATAVFHPVRDAGVWISVAGAKAAGLSRYYPEFVSVTTDGGPSLTDYRGNPTTGFVHDADGFRAGTLGGHAWYRALSARWMLTSQEKHSPSARYGTLFGDPRTTNTDTRGFVDLQFEPVFENFESLTRVHFDSYHHTSTLPYAPNAADPTSFGLEEGEYTGLWGGVEQRVIVKLPPALELTFGADLTRHFKTHQRNIDDRARPGYTGDDTGPIVDDDMPFHNIAGYALIDAALGARVQLSAGARVDYFDELDFDFGAALSPRLALIVEPYASGNLKIMAGKAFRVPSVYERFYVSTRERARIQPEQVLSAEAEFTHRFSSAVSGVLTAYANHVSDLIELGTVPRGDELSNRYRNSDAPVLVLGSEAELRRDWRHGFMLASSVSVQRASYLNDDNLRRVPNSPLVLASAKAAMPILGRALALATRLSIDGPRPDNVNRERDAACDPDGEELAPCPEQGMTDTGVIWDIVFTGAVERFGVSYAVGFYNAMDWQYDTVPSTEYGQRTIRQRPRSLLASVELEF
jgi:outer membrane receptor protein involved in Fe transport